MDKPPPAAVPKPCCVCDAPGGKHCTKCKSRHYCSKKCQLVDWKEGGHKEQCKQLAAKFQDRLLDELMPAKLKIKEEPPIVAPADGFKARLSAVPTHTTALVKATALNGDAPDWRGTCAICLDELPVGFSQTIFMSCCSKALCAGCSFKCREYDDRLRRLQKHADKGNAEAQLALGEEYNTIGLKQNFKQAVQLYELAAAQGHLEAQSKLEACYEAGEGVKIDYKAATQWFRRAVEQGHPNAQFNLGL